MTRRLLLMAGIDKLYAAPRMYSAFDYNYLMMRAAAVFCANLWKVSEQSIAVTWIYKKRPEKGDMEDYENVIYVRSGDLRLGLGTKLVHSFLGDLIMSEGIDGITRPKQPVV